MLGAMTLPKRAALLCALTAGLVVASACERAGAKVEHRAPPAAATAASSGPPMFPAEPAAARIAAAEPTTVAVAQPPGAAPEIARPYDESADAAAAIEAAFVASRADQRDVLLVFGANWCPWCRRLEHTLTQDAAVAAEVTRNFHVVHVDTGARGTGKNAAIAARYGEPTRLGLPVLVVLSPDGQLKTTQETGALESGDRHDPAAILAFITRVRS